MYMPHGACEKVASDFGLGSEFCQVSSTSYNWQVTTKPQYGKKSDAKRNSTANILLIGLYFFLSDLW